MHTAFRGKGAPRSRMAVAHLLRYVCNAMRRTSAHDGHFHWMAGVRLRDELNVNTALAVLTPAVIMRASAERWFGIGQ